MSKKKTEFIAKITPYDRQKRRGAIDAKFGKSVRGKAFEPQVPQELRLKYGTSAVFFGGADESCIVGLPEGADGHILIVGGSGSGKSTGIAMPTLQTWRRPIVVTDIKGELSRHYRRLLRRGMVDRPCMVTVEERTKQAQKKLDAAERKQKIERRCAEEAEKKQASRRKYQLGAMVLRFFPELEKAEQSELDRFECIMDALAASPKQMQMLETIAAERHNISEVCNV